MNSDDLLSVIQLTAQLAGITTVLLLIVGTPLAWWLAQTRCRLRPLIEATIALPLVLPPTVLGFYFLIAFAPGNPVSTLWQNLTGQRLAFSFEGLVIASMVYSLPFVVQPLQNSFRQLPHSLLETAETLGAGYWDRWFSIILPMCRSGFISAATLGFAHTVGEFGVVLMIGGNIPGETRVLSLALYEEVELMNYSNAHWLAGGLMLFSLLTLALLYRQQKNQGWLR